jgi:glucokinase
MTPTSARRVGLSEAQRPFFFGIDVGGTNIKIGIVDDDGGTLAFRQIPTQKQLGPADAVARIAVAASEMLIDLGLTLSDINIVGLGTPGTMDIPKGMLLQPPNLPTWRQFPIRDELSPALSKPVVFANDGAAAAYGEYWVGTGSELASVVMLTLGTGVGGGIILDGVSLDGQHSHGGECGHVIIDSSDDARACPCGQEGHLEAYASATAVAKRTAEILNNSDRASTIRPRVESGELLTSLMVAEEANRGDALADEIVMQTADYLAIAVVSLVHTVDPEGVILGGAMDFGGNADELGRRFVGRVRAGFQQNTFPLLAEKVTIDFASLGGDAGYLGAAGLARAAAKASG